MKTCSKCGEEKPISEFGERAGRKARRSYCKACAVAYRKQHYADNAEKYRVAAKRRRARIRKQVRAIKAVPCADCGKSYPYYVMDFDHRDGEEKIAEVGTLLRKDVAEKILMEEIAKCDVVCSNCHRKRTYRRDKGDW